jgi:hypothetical protein
VEKENRRSLGFARDDKGEGSAHLGMDGGGWTEHTSIATNLIWLARVLFNTFSKLRRPEDHCSANLDSSKVCLLSSNSLSPDRVVAGNHRPAPLVLQGRSDATGGDEC